jgi:tetraacyldisaccharide 4'-kinase
MISIEKRIRNYADRPVFFSSIRYGNPTPFFLTTGLPTTDVVLVTGISNAKPFEAFVAETYRLVDHMRFNDHHQYTKRDVAVMAEKARNNPSLTFLTTEKDRVKLDAAGFRDLLASVRFFFIPIEIDFLKGGKDFDEMILNAVNGKK